MPLGQVSHDPEDFGVDHGLLGQAATRETFKDQHPTPSCRQGPVGKPGELPSQGVETSGLRA